MKLLLFRIFFFFFFKQKTAYEMVMSDWSSDVCSSDLWWRRLRRGPWWRPPRRRCLSRSSSDHQRPHRAIRRLNRSLFRQHRPEADLGRGMLCDAEVRVSNALQPCGAFEKSAHEGNVECP